MLGISFFASEFIKWLKQKWDCLDPKLLLSQGYRSWLCNAFRLLLTDLKVQFSLLIILEFENCFTKSISDMIGSKTSPSEVIVLLLKFQTPCSYSSPSSSLPTFCLDLCFFFIFRLLLVSTVRTISFRLCKFLFQFKKPYINQIMGFKYLKLVCFVFLFSGQSRNLFLLMYVSLRNLT